jgi:hypothetical protein
MLIIWTVFFRHCDGGVRNYTVCIGSHNGVITIICSRQYPKLCGVECAAAAAKACYRACAIGLITKFVIAYKNRQYTFSFYSQILTPLKNPNIK